MSVYIIRLIDWQLIHGDEYLKVANAGSTYTLEAEAKRGEILDANGVDFAINATGYKIVFDRLYMREGAENSLILEMIALMAQKGQEWRDVLPIRALGNGSFGFIDDRASEIDELKKTLKLNNYATAKNCMDEMEQRYGCSGYSDEEKRNICSVRYNMTKSGYDQAMTRPYTFAENISPDILVIVSEKAQRMPGVTIRPYALRKDVNGTIAPHIVGATGKLTKEEYGRLKDKYELDDIIGKSGIELAMEDYLRGEGGKKVVRTTSDGSVLNEVSKEAALPGHTVFLTIDAKLQKRLNESLKANVEGAKKGARDCRAGAVVVLNVKDFSILAACTYPGYDLMRYVEDKDYYQSVVSDKINTPLVNRAFNGAFAPGSIYKPVVACAALEENAISNASPIYCNGRYDYYASSGFYIHCMGRHGNTAVKNALAKSCNVFFAETGRRLGIEKLDLYAGRFGLGIKTGVEVYESKGVLAGPAFSEAMGSVWYNGNTSQAAIGQSDNMFTPLQLATYTAIIANGGHRYRTHVVKKITDYTRGSTVMENSEEHPELVEEVGISDKNFRIVQEGMREVVLTGTARDFSSYPVPIAAKTGTAENAGSDHTTFICYAPYDAPEIAIAVVIEHGAKANWSKNVARDALDAYFFQKGVEEIPPTDLSVFLDKKD